MIQELMKAVESHEHICESRSTLPSGLSFLFLRPLGFFPVE